MKARNISGLMILFTFIIWIVWDVYAFMIGKDATLSVYITDWYYYSPPFAFVMGALFDHWFIPNYKADKLK